MGLQSSVLPVKVSSVTGDRPRHIHRLPADQATIRAENYHHQCELSLQFNTMSESLTANTSLSSPPHPTPLVIADTHKKTEQLAAEWCESLPI